MKRFFGLLIGALIALTPASAQSPQVRAVLLGVGGPAAGGVNNTALDGIATGTSGTGVCTTTATLTTTQANDVIILFTAAFSGAGTISSVSGGGLTWTPRGSTSDGGGHVVFEYRAIAASALTAQTITVTWNATCPQDGVIHVFGISGANTSSPFDANGSLPALGVTPSISTSNANDFVFASLYTNNNTQSAGSGWTSISSFHFMQTEYKIVTTTQSALSATITGDTNNSGIGDAVKSN